MEDREFSGKWHLGHRRAPGALQGFGGGAPHSHQPTTQQRTASRAARPRWGGDSALNAYALLEQLPF